MGYVGPGLRTRPDLSRQIYQPCNSTARLSGSTIIDHSLQVMLSGSCSTFSGSTLGNDYGFTITASTGNTVVVAIGQSPDRNSQSGLQISPDIVPNTGSVTDLEYNTTTGEVVRTASSLRYKKDVEPLSYDRYKNILNLNPVQFKWKSNNKESVGFIAEEAHHLGLTDFVGYNEKGEPDSIGYKLLSIALIGILKKGVVPPLQTSTQKSESSDNIPITIQTDYQTSTTRYIIAQKDLTITLNDSVLKRYYIKSMANITIVPTKGLIDEEWEGIEMGPQSSIEVIAHEGNWYVLSSDGLKNS